MKQRKPAQVAKADETHARIWQAVREIPRGRVATYGQIAEAAGFGRHARLVGYALHHLDAKTNVPWHRVINAQGRISFPPRSRPWREQRKRLEAEGIVLIGGRVDLARHGLRASVDEMLWKP
jgi:methylated-DNA-protein-cysteine methyltransferase-like protein